MSQWCVWLAIIVILAVLEAMTVNLTTIWFVASGFVALIISFFTDSYLIQFGAFVLIGVILLVTTKPLLDKTIKPKKSATNAERVLEMKGLVTEKISKNHNGEVKVDGKRWTAYSDSTIEVGSTVNILKINGVKLKVEEEK
ncbi:MAG: NfeD family protein [Bacilli bacterium]|nr:NfeD family protein [Bacilli bacterium]